MSSSTFEYTLDERAALLDQFASVMKITQERQRPAAMVSQALQAVISNDDFVVVPKVTVTPTGKVFHLTGNARSAKEAIDALNCPVKRNFAEKPAKIPMIIQPVDCRARAIRLEQVKTTEEIYKLYSKILTPVEFFAFGAKFPEEQRQTPYLTVWLDGVGRFWYATLDVGGDGRCVRVDYQINADDKWSGLFCVLVRK